MSSNEQTETETETPSQERGGRCRGRGRRRWAMPFIFAAILLIKSAAIMVLWNYLVPDLFHGPVLAYGQALGLTVLAKLLVGFGGPFGRGHHRFGRMHHHMHERWSQMTPEEREKLKAELKNRWNG